MKKRDLFRMKLGNYELTDGIYNYILRIGLFDDGQRYYKITEKGYDKIKHSLTIHEDIEQNDNGFEYKTLSALTFIGGISIHSDNVFAMIIDLKFIARGSFAEFINRTTANS